MNGHDNHEASEWLPVDESFGTSTIHHGYKASDASYNAIAEPISLSATFELDAPFKIRGFAYTRVGNPTRKILEERLAKLEGGEYGDWEIIAETTFIVGLCYSSGSSAILSAMELLTSGDHLLCGDCLYGGTVQLINECGQRRKLEFDFVDCTNLEIFKSSLKPTTKMVFFETPGNPTLCVVDIQKICDIAHEYSKDIIVIVDNTFLTCYYQKPLLFGADIVHYSLTKYMNGHTDVLMGSLITSRPDLFEKLKTFQSCVGPVPSPFDCYLMLRGLKTLHIRMPVFMKNGLAIAHFLEKHPKVGKVLHPGLETHPQHELALKQSSGHSGLISFYISNGSSITFLENLKIFQNAGSLGGCESLVELPFYFTHAKIGEKLQTQLGITENLVRLAIGLESVKDLIQDLNQALAIC